MRNKFKGSSFDDFLEEEGLLAETELVAIKRVITYEIEQAMKNQHLSKSKLAAKMHTSRAALDRLLDPKNTSITLSSLVRAAKVLGKKTEVHLVDA